MYLLVRPKAMVAQGPHDDIKHSVVCPHNSYNHQLHYSQFPYSTQSTTITQLP
jgi:hypothetical protein